MMGLPPFVGGQSKSVLVLVRAMMAVLDDDDSVGGWRILLEHA